MTGASSPDLSTEERLERAFRLLANETRVKILFALDDEELGLTVDGEMIVLGATRTER